METLIIKKHRFGKEFYLEDSKHNLLGWFKSAQEAADWCVANGYKYRIQN